MPTGIFRNKPTFGKALVICGCPRSGTTWLHNILIEIGRYRGVPGDDMLLTDARPFFVTDENSYLQQILQAIAVSNSPPRKILLFASLKFLTTLLYLRFGKGGEFLLKSPYYCFVLLILKKAGLAGKIVYTKRSLDSVALSMLSHSYLPKLIAADYDGFFDMSFQLETAHIPANLVREFQDRYDRLSFFDRALFKSLCFSSAFASARSAFREEDIFILNYDEFGASAEQQRSFARFLSLTNQEVKHIERSFRPSSKPEPQTLPMHDAGFRSAVLRANEAIWRLGEFSMDV